MRINRRRGPRSASVPPRAAAHRRAVITGLWLLGALALLGIRLIQLQLFAGPTLAAAAGQEHEESAILPASRGEITDRNGEILAISVPAVRVTADPTLIPADQQAAVAKALGGILDAQASQILTDLTRPPSPRYVLLQGDASAAQGQAVAALNLPGIFLSATQTRQYPNGFSLGDVLGFVNANGGAAGVEQSYQAALAGTNGYTEAQVDVTHSLVIPNTPGRTVAPIPGDNLQLTIDAGLQSEAEGLTEAAVATTGAKAVYAIVMQPDGAILADASWPTFDPGSYALADPSVWTNTIQGVNLVPGSVFKTVTASAVLATGLAVPSTPFTDPGYLAVSGIHLTDFERLPISTTFAKAFYESSNVVFGGLGLRLGSATFYNYLQAFGLTGTPGSDLPGESPDILAAEKGISPIDLAEEAFGETLSVTPLSLITAVNVIADGGTLVRPHVGETLTDAHGNVVRRIGTTAVRRVLPASVVQTMRQLMLGVVDDGTGQRGFLPCYDVAGKTGTANIYGPSGVTDHYIASFVAFAPADDPKAVVLVMLKDPQGQANEGGEVAAPVTQALMADAMRTLGVPPHCTATNTTPPAPGDAGTTNLVLDMVSMPSLVQLTPAQAQAAATAVNIRLQVSGSGPVVLRQNPPPGAMVQRWTAVDAYTTAAALLPGDFIATPDLAGQTIAEAAGALAKKGLALDAAGVGIALNQSPAAGMPAPPGSTVAVTFGS